MSVRDVIQAAAGNSGDSKTYIEDVFSTYLYTGNNSATGPVINNGIDLAGKGGMVWLKQRTSSNNNCVFDTLRGVSRYLFTNTTGTSDFYNTFGVKSFNSNGFSLGDNGFGENSLGAAEVSWTFRKAPKFFDVVTYTGNGAATRDIAHSLGVAPGMIIVKNTSIASNWFVWHRSIDNNITFLERTDAAVSSPGYYFGSGSTQTASNFRILYAGGTNSSGSTYVAYLFAHDTTTDGLIQCGSFNAPTSGTLSVNLGFEPQYLLLKRTDSTGGWYVIDNMRGFSLSGTPTLYANTSDAELPVNSSPFDATYRLNPTATGFELKSGAIAGTYIYMAIRRGPMKTPTDGTAVFQPVVRTGSGAAAVVNTTITPDLIVHKARAYSGGQIIWLDRLRDNYYLYSDSTNGTAAEAATTANFPTQMWDNQTGYDIAGTSSPYNSTSYSYIDWAFKRAPGFFDVVCYTGTGSNQNITHNLGVAPELLVIKKRSSTGSWSTWHKDIGNNYLLLNSTQGSTATGNTARTVSSTTFGIYGNFSDEGANGATYAAYIFASCPGVSKVGSYTGNGSSQTINCGFSAGARFVLIKRTDSAGDWYVWDTARGIVSANDPHLSLNTTAAEVTTDDTIDPDSTGFIVNQVTATNVNVSSATYIYFSVA